MYGSLWIRCGLNKCHTSISCFSWTITNNAHGKFAIKKWPQTSSKATQAFGVLHDFVILLWCCHQYYRCSLPSVRPLLGAIDTTIFAIATATDVRCHHCDRCSRNQILFPRKDILVYARETHMPLVRENEKIGSEIGPEVLVHHGLQFRNRMLKHIIGCRKCSVETCYNQNSRQGAALEYIRVGKQALRKTR